MTQQADDSTSVPQSNPLLDQLEIEADDAQKIWLDEVAERERELEREHDELRQHDYDNPTTGFEYDYLQHTQPKEASGILPSVTGGVILPQKGYRHKKASEIKEEQVPWLWKNRIPFGCLTILDGDPGVGKTTIVLDLMARLSTKRPMPFEDAPLSEMNSLVVSVEDSVAYTIVPRLHEAGANLERVHILIDFPLFPSGLEKLKSSILETHSRLVMIDPGLAMFDQGINTSQDADTRRVVGGLAALAAATESAIIFVRHLTKAQRAEAMYRGGGSIAISAAARSCLLAKFPRGKNSKSPVLACYKASLCLRPSTLSYQIVGNAQDPAKVSHIDWLAEIGMTADEALEGDLPLGMGGSSSGGVNVRQARQEGALQAKLLAILALAGEKGATVPELMKASKKRHAAVKQALDDLVESAQAKFEEETSGEKGRPKGVYRLGDEAELGGPQESFDD